MDSSRFDEFVRRLPSRRRLLTSLLAAGSAAVVATSALPEAGEARNKKKCGGGKKKCGKKCIAKSKCCKNKDCPGTTICAKGRCVVGSGTCSAGRDICVDQTTLAICNAPAAFGCLCFRTTGGQTRCGNAEILAPGGDSCIDDDDCAKAHPTIPGVFCTRGGQSDAGSGDVCVTFNYCQAPCPA